MPELWLAPFNVYYSQGTIGNCFKESSEHMGNLIGETVDDILFAKTVSNR